VVGAVSWQAQRRLAQNREAARKSRMRKKVIIPTEASAHFDFVIVMQGIPSCVLGFLLK
jgi:hypothetical protein